MSNLQNNVESPMLEPRRPKRDAIQKRIRKLKIGIYTSFILSLVAVALSIVLLTKVQKLQEEMAAIQSELSKFPTEEVKEFYKKVHKLESTVENFRDNLFNYNLRPFLIKNETTKVKSLPPNPDHDIKDNVIFYKEHPFDNKTKAEAENPHEDVSIGLVDNVDPIVEASAVDVEEETPESSHHHHHHHMTEDEDSPKVDNKKKMCDNDNTDDSDLCEETEGSGASVMGIIDDGEWMLLTEGSGDYPEGCMHFPVPDCSSGYSVCYSVDDATKCPVPVCCPES